MIRNYLLLILFAIAPMCGASWKLSKRQFCDLELIMNGGFSPLKGFMNQDDYESVVHNLRLADGSVWPMPIVLDVTREMYESLALGDALELKAEDGTFLAKLHVESKWQPDKLVEAQNVYKTQSTDHPGVAYLYNQTNDYYVGGAIEIVQMPEHHDFPELYRTPAELKALLAEKQSSNVVAFQTRNPMHYAHIELTKRAAEQVDACLLIHPIVGMTKPGDIDHFTRVKCYKEVVKKYPADQEVVLSVLPVSMRMTGPREALWHALIRKNYGATHFIVGRDHAGPGPDRYGNNFYGLYEAQELVKAYEEEIGITLIPFQAMLYVEDCQCYMPANEVPDDAKVMVISGTKFRQMLYAGLEIPSWFSPKEVVKQLKKVYKPTKKQGFTLFMTGLSGAGKSTLTEALAQRLHGMQSRPITILDGDEVRKFISSELGFSKEHRSLNVRRVGFISREITRNGGIAICPMIAPYQEDRDANREMIAKEGGFIELYIATPLEVCADRDPKGLYALVEQGKIQNFTGVSDPYEVPEKPELIIRTEQHTLKEEVDMIIDYLVEQGYLN